MTIQDFFKYFEDNMKKKVLILVCFIIFVFVVFLVFYFINTSRIDKNNQKRYEEIRESVNDEMYRYWYIVWPTCDPSETAEQHVRSDELIKNGGMNKELFLDVDGESYCSSITYTKCFSKNLWYFDTYIKCKNYEEKR